MNRDLLRVTALCAASTTFGPPLLARAQQPSACGSVRDRVHDTVIVFQPPTSFAICRGGKLQDDVVTGRPVYLELTPTPGSRMFDFRIHGQASEWTPTGLSAWQQQADRIASGLYELEDAGEPISSFSVPTEGAPAPLAALRPLAAARSRYLGVVTSRYIEIVQGARADARDLPVIAGVVRRWCAELGGDAPASIAVGAELQARCAGPELREGALEKAVGAMDAAIRTFDAKRVGARDAAVAATAHPDDGNMISGGVRALDDARHAADDVIAAGRPLREASRALARDLGILRSAIRSIDAVRPGVPTYLSRYTTAGNAELEIDANPVDIGAVGEAAEQKTAGKTTLRFPIVGRHYFDLDAGVGVTAGMPQIPTVGTASNKAVLEGRDTGEFVGLAQLELEPARFLWPDRPWAGIVRLPVLAVPFTRDPTQNFFFGGGLGWTGVGSLTAGPYLLRELSLRDGYALGETLPAGTSLDAVTQPSLQVGYFVSASVDLLGLFHLFFPEHLPAIDAATGKEK